MIALLMALQIVSADARVPVAYDQVPPEVIRAELFAWNGDRPGRREAVAHGSRRFTLAGTARGVYIAALFRADGRYLIDGPFAWPERHTTRGISAPWRLTVGGALPAGGDASTRVEFLRPRPGLSSWPACFADGLRWSCWGVAADDRGIVIASSGPRIWWTTLGFATLQDLRSARWGRLVVVGGPATDEAPAKVSLRYPVAPPAGRMRAIRLDTAVVPNARVVPLSSTAVWVAGDEIPRKAWLEVTSDNAAPIFMPLEDVAGVTLSVPLHLELRERRVVDGRVLAGNGEPAAGALVSVFRLLDPPDQPGGRPLPRRVLAAETMADEEGRFALTDLGDAEYELLAWHTQLGRASMVIPAIGAQLNVRLERSGVARGRVLSNGRPLEGVVIISVPDAATFTAADDMTQVKGGDGRTGSDGRFSVAIAPSGGGELRIGGGAYPVKRVALPRGSVPVFDAGDIDLGRRIPITVVLDHDPGCAVRAAGPVGRTGLQIIESTRTPAGVFELAVPEPGFWEFTLVCGAETRQLSPSVVQIGLTDSGREMRMAVR